MRRKKGWRWGKKERQSLRGGDEERRKGGDVETRWVGGKDGGDKKGIEKGRKF